MVDVGAVAPTVMTMYASTMPAQGGEPWSGPITAPLWILVAAVNAATWAAGIGIGVAIDLTSRRHRVAPPPARATEPE